MQTSIRVSEATRDELAGIASKEMGGASLDEALARLLFEHRSLAAITALEADPQALADYQTEARQWAELDVAVTE